ncbi:ATP-binding cassette domain-containing protein [Microbacterium sp. BG28]|uniref:ABC transporter ATP-binding protein n=1 Tax=Microbacterium sp. BG28 TaxID=3097356 RepID=UPI002A5AD7AC|nr:ATP-binding cassette domain-containing protein [Microbacterium sp. BG28]MDY0827781.1 ATP-binding cassette domain-containing protein [Microbacterium sp. BG28]
MGDEVLVAHDVRFAYRPSLPPVIDGFNASFRRGSMTAVTGRSGVGKSSLLFLLGLMLSPDSGELTILGEPTSTTSDAYRARLRASRFGFVFQDSCLDPRRTVLDNVLQPLAFRGARRAEWKTRARDLLDRVGVSVPVDRRPGEVSGGQAQRIALCRALLAEPDIVLADEPTGNLDARSAADVMGALRSRAEAGSAVVIVTHSAEVEGLCDETIHLGGAMT